MSIRTLLQRFWPARVTVESCPRGENYRHTIIRRGVVDPKLEEVTRLMHTINAKEWHQHFPRTVRFTNFQMLRKRWWFRRRWTVTYEFTQKPPLFEWSPGEMHNSIDEKVGEVQLYKETPDFDVMFDTPIE